MVLGSLQDQDQVIQVYGVAWIIVVTVIVILMVEGGGTGRGGIRWKE